MRSAGSRSEISIIRDHCFLDAIFGVFDGPTAPTPSRLQQVQWSQFVRRVYLYPGRVADGLVQAAAVHEDVADRLRQASTEAQRQVDDIGPVLQRGLDRMGDATRSADAKEIEVGAGGDAAVLHLPIVVGHARILIGLDTPAGRPGHDHRV